MTLEEGKELANHVITKIALLFIGWFLGAGLVSLVFLFTDFGKTSVDPPGGKSGLKVRVDAFTGCHYLMGRDFFGYSEGSLVPRLDREGNQICL